ncbi:MAG: extracellular solute-binding protein [Candidatus Hydrogenedentota bacterium]|nr:MAG: extracellular solute-binding protein [Candidatus Hydrogenedentota bacterium]
MEPGEDVNLGNERWRAWQILGWIGIALVACIVLLFGSHKETVVEKGVVLHLKERPEFSYDNLEVRAEKAVFKEFIRRHPEITLRNTSDLKVPNTPSTELLSIAGNIAPDVFRVSFSQMRSYIEEGFVADITDDLDTEYRRNIPEKIWKIAEKEGRYYGIPAEYMNAGLIYNKQLVAEAGLDPEKPPQTWEELFYWAQVLTDRDKIMHWGDKTLVGRWGLGWLLGEAIEDRNFTTTAGEFFANLVWQYGGKMAVEKDGKYRVSYASPAGKKALDLIWKFKWAHWFKDEQGRVITLRDASGNVVVTRDQFEKLAARGPYRDEYGQKWDLRKLDSERRIIRGVINGSASGEEALGGTSRGFVLFAVGAERCAMAIGYPRRNLVKMVQGYGHKDLYGFAPLPVVKGGRPANMVRGFVYAVNAQIRDPKIRKAAVEYIKFLCSEEANRMRTEQYLAEDWGILVRPDWLRKFGYNDVYEQIPKEWRESYQKMMAHSRLAPLFGKYAQIQSNELKEPLQRILLADAEKPDLMRLLKTSEKRANTMVLGMRDPKDMARKRRIAIIVLSLAVLVIGFIVVRYLRELTQAYSSDTGPAAVSGRKGGWTHHVGAWIFLIPAVLTILLFQYYPLLRGSAMAFYDWKLLGPKTFVGLDNFIEAFSQPLFYKVVKNTLYYVGLTMSLGFVAPVILAILLAEVPKGKIFFRVIYYIPYVTTGLVILFLWKMLYYPGESGFLNTLLAHFGLGPYRWLEDPKLAMICVVLPGIWAGAGAGSIIYLAALAGIPEEVYEAADLDGAGVFDKIIKITIPFLKPLLIINFVGAFIGAFHASANILMMTGGGPLNATNVLGTEIFIKSFIYLKFGYATALAWILGAFLIGFTLQQLKIMKNLEYRTTGK